MKARCGAWLQPQDFGVGRHRAAWNPRVSCYAAVPEAGLPDRVGRLEPGTTPAYGGDGESRPRDSRGETGIPRIYPWGGGQKTLDGLPLSRFVPRY